MDFDTFSKLIPHIETIRLEEKMKYFKTLSIIGLIITGLWLFTGCSTKVNTNVTKEEVQLVESVKGPVEIPKNPQRIVDVSGSSEELILMGYTPVGTANIDSYQTDRVPSYIEDKLGNAKVVGHTYMETMDMEAILSLNPDLIIMSPRQEKIYNQLTDIAPTVMMKDFENDWESKLKAIGKLFQKEAKAQKWLDDYYIKAKKIGDEIKNKKKDETYLTILSSSGQFMVFTQGGIGTVLNNDMGLPQPKNMPPQEGISLPVVSLEGLTKIDADNIILIATASDKADLEKNSVFQEIRAVKDGNLIVLDTSPYFSQAYNPIGRELLLASIKKEILNK